MTEEKNLKTEGISTESLGQSEHFDLIGFLSILLQQKKMILLGVLISGLSSYGILTLIPNKYQSTSLVIPVITDGVKGAGSEGFRNTSDYYINIMKSRTIADRLINQFSLLSAYGVDESKARQILEKNTQISSTREGMIKISVEDTDPKRSADLANAYSKEANDQMAALYKQAASVQRPFLEKELINVEKKLTSADAAFSKLRERLDPIQLAISTFKVLLNGSSQNALGGANQVAMERSDNSVRTRTYQPLTEEMLRIQAELASQKRMFKDGRVHAEDFSTLVEINRVQNNIHELEMRAVELRRQVDDAARNESREIIFIQTLDSAIPLLNPVSPRRIMISFGVALFVLSLSVVSVYMRMLWDLRMMRDESFSDCAKELVKALRA